MNVANRIRMAVALSALLLVAAIATGMPQTVITIVSVLPGAWAGARLSTAVFTRLDEMRSRARERQRVERRMRHASTRGHSTSLQSGTRLPALAA